MALAESPIESSQTALSAADKIRSLKIDTISRDAATKLGIEYFSQENDLFTQRSLAVRDRVPAEIGKRLDQQAEEYKQFADALAEGDTRLIKSYIFESAMDINRSNPNAPRDSNSFGNRLYMVGYHMSATAPNK